MPAIIKQRKYNNKAPPPKHAKITTLYVQNGRKGSLLYYANDTIFSPAFISLCFSDLVCTLSTCRYRIIFLVCMYVQYTERQDWKRRRWRWRWRRGVGAWPTHSCMRAPFYLFFKSTVSRCQESSLFSGPRSSRKKKRGLDYFLH